MNPYSVLYGMAVQKQLEVRSDFVFERSRSICVLLTLYFLWTALLQNQTHVAGYDKAALLTYLLLTTVLRAVVLSCVTDRMPSEIAKGHLSDILLRPISNLRYWLMQDLASKSINIVSLFFEIAIFLLLFRPPLEGPSSVLHGLMFGVAVFLAMGLYFQLSYVLGLISFWTSDSWGPRFCFEIILEFAAGAFFPLDFLPAAVRTIVSWSPFPSLLFNPISIYLGRFSTKESLAALLVQLAWLAFLTLLIRLLWRAGLKRYTSEGR